MKLLTFSRMTRAFCTKHARTFLVPLAAPPRLFSCLQVLAFTLLAGLEGVANNTDLWKLGMAAVAKDSYSELCVCVSVYLCVCVRTGIHECS
jgi:hypothetical protein